VRTGRVGAAVLSLSSLLFAASAAQAQTSSAPLPGFLSPYEASRIVRTAGFDPVTPPLREGPTYVLRAIDFRGVLMRVVVDARSGALRAVNRIVANPETYGPVGMLTMPEAGPVPYGPPEFASRETTPGDELATPPTPPVAAVDPVAVPLLSEPVPLPRPRPAQLDARRAVDDGRVAGQSPGRAATRTAYPTAPAALKRLPPAQISD
jgi:hypothetical protein